VEIESQKAIVRRFVEQTMDYARNEIEVRTAEIQTLPDDQKGERVRRLYQWISYLEFQEHTLKELSGDKLDRFFEKPEK